jgi:hypothetical protein
MLFYPYPRRGISVKPRAIGPVIVYAVHRDNIRLLAGAEDPRGNRPTDIVAKSAWWIVFKPAVNNYILGRRQGRSCKKGNRTKDENLPEYSSVAASP